MSRERAVSIATWVCGSIIFAIMLDQGVFRYDPYVLPALGLFAAVLYGYWLMTHPSIVKRPIVDRFLLLVFLTLVVLGAFYIGLAKNKEAVAIALRASAPISLVMVAREEAMSNQTVLSTDEQILGRDVSQLGISWSSAGYAPLDAVKITALEDLRLRCADALAKNPPVQYAVRYASDNLPILNAQIEDRASYRRPFAMDSSTAPKRIATTENGLIANLRTGDGILSDLVKSLQDDSSDQNGCPG